ncbi:MAG: hypothetical protein JW791_03660 [Nanoarchaeota archaeon]|nr:hypothetical protein [Nanoarchaeota archaeon]
MIPLIYFNPNMEKDEHRRLRSGAFSCPGSWNAEFLYELVKEKKNKDKILSKD